MTINIAGIPKAEVLVALFNASKQQGMGFLHVEGAKPMTVEQAEKYVTSGQDDLAAHFGKDDIRNKESLYFDYLLGRVMKVDIGGDELRDAMFDRDNGPGAAARALAPLQAKYQKAGV